MYYILDINKKKSFSFPSPCKSRSLSLFHSNLFFSWYNWMTKYYFPVWMLFISFLLNERIAHLLLFFNILGWNNYYLTSLLVHQQCITPILYECMIFWAPMQPCSSGIWQELLTVSWHRHIVSNSLQKFTHFWSF